MWKHLRFDNTSCVFFFNVIWWQSFIYLPTQCKWRQINAAACTRNLIRTKLNHDQRVRYEKKKHKPRTYVSNEMTENNVTFRKPLFFTTFDIFNLKHYKTRGNTGFSYWYPWYIRMHPVSFWSRRTLRTASQIL